MPEAEKYATEDALLKEQLEVINGLETGCDGGHDEKQSPRADADVDEHTDIYWKCGRVALSDAPSDVGETHAWA